MQRFLRVNASSIGPNLTKIAFCWIFVFLAWGGTSKGKKWYAELSKHAIEGKSGVILINLVFPLLIASSACSLFLVAASSRTTGSRFSRYVRYRWCSVGISLRGYKPNKILPDKNIGGRGDSDLNAISLLVVGVPCLLFLCSNLWRHLYQSKKSVEFNIMEAGNSFGATASVAMSFFLVPVSRHSVLLSAMGWSPVNAIRIHILAGRICVIGGAIHGCLHMLRWLMMGENVISMLSPPPSCWSLSGTNKSKSLSLTCVNGDTDCSCHDRFRNFTGFVASALLIVLACSSLGWVRRLYHSFFYKLHMILGPGSIIMLVLHWKRMIFYVCPSIIYYVATTVPVLVQSLHCYLEGGVRVVNAYPIPDSRGCVEISFEASPEAVNTLRTAAAQYARVQVPEISLISHPFSVFQPPNDQRTVNVMFRPTGHFTRTLSRRFTDTSLRPFPKIIVDGFYGGSDRIDQALHHDTVCIIAGGIGITPYLSMIPMLKAIIGSETNSVLKKTTNIVLHWMCRDKGLIQHVQKHYFEHFIRKIDEECEMSGLDCCNLRIVIHHTYASSGTEGSLGAYDLEPVEDERNNHGGKIESFGTRLIPARFLSKDKTSISANIPSTIVFSLISWLGLWAMWSIHESVKSTSVWTGVWGLVAVAALGLLISSVAEIIMAFVSSSPACLEKRRAKPTFNNTALVPLEAFKENDLYLREESGHDMTPSGDTKEENQDSDDSRGGQYAKQSEHRLEHAYGRPEMGEVLDDIFQSSEKPGIFLCGPSAMIAMVRFMLGEEKCLGIGCRLACAVYEESFKL